MATRKRSGYVDWYTLEDWEIWTNVRRREDDRL